MFLERSKNVIKKKGEILFPTLLAETIAPLCPAATAVVVTEWYNAAMDTRYLVLVLEEQGPQGFVKLPELEEKLTKTLPDFQIPDFIFRVNAMPRNNVGKVDRAQFEKIISASQ